MTRTAASPALESLARLTDDTGLFEHAWHATPRRNDGYCTDDNGRALAIVSLLGGDDAIALAETYLAFLVHAHRGGGSFRLRLGYDRRWTGHDDSHDANGRALYGLGVAAAHGPDYHIRRDALALFTLASGFRSGYWRATAAAVCGASAVLAEHPGHHQANAIIADATVSLPRPVDNVEWPWPESRLSYESARLPLALLHVGTALGLDVYIDQGFVLLDWLIDHHLKETHLSLPGSNQDNWPAVAQFDQQPVEAWAFADAAAMGMKIAPSARYARTVEMAAAWFEGRNDIGVAMVDPSTGGAYDGLEPDGVNLNQGAESLLALLGTRWAAQHAHQADNARVFADPL